MLITSLTLENVKSYGREEIHFTEGLNAISGHNGSGKTTVLEAIGYALFGFVPYAQADILREGQKSGAVRVCIVALDGREYEIVRKVGGGSYYVTDLETGTRIADRGPNVLEWIRTNALGIDGDTLLESLFKNAVGVPQGLMTADFLTSPGSRKAVFDPLLRVEEYRDAYEQLRETRAYLVDMIATANEGIARLETETRDIVPLRESIASLIQGVRQSETRLAGLAADLENAEAAKDVLDAVERELVADRQRLSETKEKVAGFAATLEQQEHAVEAARIARREFERAESGYRAVLEARKRLGELDQRRRERDELERCLAGVTARVRGINENIQTLEAQARDARVRAQEAAELEEAVAKQADLESALQDAALRLQAEAGLRDRAAALDRECRDAERHIVQIGAEIEADEQAREEVGRLAVVQAELRDLGDAMASLKARRERMVAVETEGKTLRERHDRLALECARLGEIRRQIERVAPEAGILDGLIEGRQTLAEELALIRAAVEYQGIARAALERQHCPLLELQCPAVSAQPALLTRFDQRVSAFQERLPSLQAELVRVDRLLSAAREAVAALQKLRLEEAQLASSEIQLEETDVRLKACRAEYTELKQEADGESALQRQYAALQASETALREAAGRVARLEPLQAQLKRERDLMEARHAELADIKRQGEALDVVRAEVLDLRAQLATLNDPRSRQQALLAVAGRIAGLQQQLDSEQQRLQLETDRLRATVVQKQRYAALDTDIETQTRIEAERNPEYERYLAYREEANALETRELAAARTRTSLTGAQNEESEARRRLERAEVRYDATHHAALKARCEELGREIASQTTAREHLRRDLAGQEEQLAYLQRQDVKLQRARVEREELEQTQQALSFIRDTIKAAGPAITETLLRNISQVANDLFAEIMDDHAAELRWDRDYEVMVQRGAETRKFAQLSGGEQMSAALAVRLALLKEMSEVDVAFFDEPTQNMDEDRRSNLAEQIRKVRGFKQLIVISHDDTFEHDTDNLIRLHKVDGETRVVV